MLTAIRRWGTEAAAEGQCRRSGCARATRTRSRPPARCRMRRRVCRSRPSSERKSDDRHRNLDRGPGDADPNTRALSCDEHQRVPWPCSQARPDVEPGTDCDREDSSQHQRDAHGKCRRGQGIDQVTRCQGVDHQSDEHRVRDRSRADARTEGRCEHEDGQSDHDIRRTERQPGAFRNTLVENIPRWQPES